MSPRSDTASAGPGMRSPGARTYMRTGVGGGKSALGPSTWRGRTHSPERLLQVVQRSDPVGMERVCVPRRTGPSLVLHSRVRTGTLRPDSCGFTGPATKGREAATDVRCRQACWGGSGQAVGAVHVPMLLGGSLGGGHLLWKHRGWNKHGGCPPSPCTPPEHPAPTPPWSVPSATSDPRWELNKTCWSRTPETPGVQMALPTRPQLTLPLATPALRLPN